VIYKKKYHRRYIQQKSDDFTTKTKHFHLMTTVWSI